MRRSICLLLSLLVIAALSWNVAWAKKPITGPGQQSMTARQTNAAPSLDGVLGPGEWSAAIPTHITFVQPKNPPGIVHRGGDDPGFTPSSPSDLSFKVYAMYDEDNLYIAVDVRDDALWADGGYGYTHDEHPWTDDSVELYFDGDNMPNDMSIANGFFWPCREGFQIIKGWGGGEFMAVPEPELIVWTAEVGDRPQGYLVEFEIPLSSIDAIDGPEYASPGPGDTIGFNVAVADDDNGGAPYNTDTPEDLVDSFGFWDGSWEQIAVIYSEENWGSLHFLPSVSKPVAETTSWGQIKVKVK